MSVLIGTAPTRSVVWRRFRPALAALVAGLLVFAALFPAEAAAAVRVWIGSSAYGHCFFVLPIALYLAWDRRQRLVETPLRPLPWLALAALPLGFAWLIAERLGIMEGRQLVVIATVDLLFVAVLGWRLGRAFMTPLLFLFFLVPFGAVLTGPLQVFTTRFIVHGLNLLGIPNVSDQFTIQIPEGSFFVAEACAGLRFLIASIVFGVLYACLMYRSPWRRAGFIAASLVVPVVANGLRGLGIVVLGHVLGSAEAAATDHVLYGWLFFSLVILLLVALGLPFREDRPEAPRPAPRAPTLPDTAGFRVPFTAAAVLCLLFAAAPATAMVLDGRVAAHPPGDATFAITPPQDCAALPSPTAAPGPVKVEQYDCPAGRLTATVQVFSPFANPATLFHAERRATQESGTSDLDVGRLETPGIAPGSWRTVQTEEPSLLTAAELWIGDAPMPGGIAGRAAQAWRGLVGGPQAPVLFAVSIAPKGGVFSPDELTGAQQLIRSFLERQPDLAARIGRLSAAAARPGR